MFCLCCAVHVLCRGCVAVGSVLCECCVGGGHVRRMRGAWFVYVLCMCSVCVVYVVYVLYNS